MYEIQRTSGYCAQYNKLNLRLKRFIDEAIKIIREDPTTDYQGKILQLANQRDARVYRFRAPGLHLMYVVPEHPPGANAVITLTQIKAM